MLTFTAVSVCLQVYNEQIRDLLANAGPLAVREDSSKGVVVQGLTLHQVSRNPLSHSTAHFIKAVLHLISVTLNSHRFLPGQD